MPNGTPDPRCAFCRIAAGAAPAHVVWADAEHVAFLDRAPITAGHVVLIPRRHAPTVADLDPQAYAAPFGCVRALAGPVAAAAGAPRTGLAVEGFGVDHAHVHLVPVWRGGDLDPFRQAPAAEADLRAAAANLTGRARRAARVVPTDRPSAGLRRRRRARDHPDVRPRTPALPRAPHPPVLRSRFGRTAAALAAAAGVLLVADRATRDARRRADVCYGARASGRAALGRRRRRASRSRE